MKGRIINIQRFSIHDGPGIRTSVFLKGCNLRCAWCHNPESNSPRPEIQYFAQKCTGCGACVQACPTGAIHYDAAGVKVFDRSKCDLCGKCVEACLYDALVFASRDLTPAQVMDEVLKDLDYYRDSGGGLTISGGEPLLQKQFVRELFTLAQAHGIHTALDTAANVRWADLAYVLPVVNLVLLDLKAMDEERHRAGTTVSNERILENGRRLASQDVDLIVRIPVVPGINATTENMAQTAAYLQPFSRLKYVELLPYHDLGVDKFTSLGKDSQHAIFETPSKETMRLLAEPFAARGVPVRFD